MVHRLSAVVFLALIAGIGPAWAQSATPASDKITTGSLLAQGYTIAGTLSPPSGGAGLLLRKDAKLYFCFVSETPQSPTLSTRYCKPVE